MHCMWATPRPGHLQRLRNAAVGPGLRLNSLREVWKARCDTLRSLSQILNNNLHVKKGEEQTAHVQHNSSVLRAPRSSPAVLGSGPSKARRQRLRDAVLWQTSRHAAAVKRRQQQNNMCAMEKPLSISHIRVLVQASRSCLC